MSFTYGDSVDIGFVAGEGLFALAVPDIPQLQPERENSQKINQKYPVIGMYTRD